MFDVGVSSGSLDGFADGDVAISEEFADDHGLAVGSTDPDDVGRRRDDGPHASTAVYHDRMTFGDVIVSPPSAGGTTSPRTTSPSSSSTSPTASTSTRPRPTSPPSTERFGAPDPMDRDEYIDTVGDEIDTMLYFVYGMLGVAVIIALMGIANTLSLSIHERRRELGLLRAVGQDRAPGALDRALGVGDHRRLRHDRRHRPRRRSSAGGSCGRSRPRKASARSPSPSSRSAVVLGLAAAAGVVAALRPARRAAKTDILAAIAAD